MILNRLLILLTASILLACSPNYNEARITESDMIINVKDLSDKIEHFNIEEISYYSDEIIILNGIVINPIRRTFGKSPDGGFMMTYAEKAAEQSFDSWNQILVEAQTSPSLSEEHFNEILSDMIEIGVTDVFIDTAYNTVRIQWGNSVMWGINGLILGDHKDAESFQEYAKFDVFKKESDGIYFFQLL